MLRHILFATLILSVAGCATGTPAASNPAPAVISLEEAQTEYKSLAAVVDSANDAMNKEILRVIGLLMTGRPGSSNLNTLISNAAKIEHQSATTLRTLRWPVSAQATASQLATALDADVECVLKAKSEGTAGGEAGLRAVLKGILPCKANSKGADLARVMRLSLSLTSTHL